MLSSGCFGDDVEPTLGFPLHSWPASSWERPLLICSEHTLTVKQQLCPQSSKPLPVSVLHVWLGALVPLLVLDLSLMTRPAALNTQLPVATWPPICGDGCHGICEAGLPSPGGLTSRGEKKRRENTEEAAGFKSPVFSESDDQIQAKQTENHQRGSGWRSRAAGATLTPLFLPKHKK